MLENIKDDKRFKFDLYKTTRPYNTLTILDPCFSNLEASRDSSQRLAGTDPRGLLGQFPEAF